MSFQEHEPTPLPPFPVDDETLNVLRDSLNQTITGFDEDGNPRRSEPFGLNDLLGLLSGYDPEKIAPALNEYDQPIPDVFEYTGGPVYHQNDVIRALVDEIFRVRAENERLRAEVLWVRGLASVRGAYLAAALSVAPQPEPDARARKRQDCDSTYLGVACEWGAGHPGGTDLQGNYADHGAPSKRVWWTSTPAASLPEPTGHACGGTESWTCDACDTDAGLAASRPVEPAS